MTIAYPYLKITTKEYLGSPVDYIEIPPEATTIAPPVYIEGTNIPIFDDLLETWSLVDDFRGQEYLNTIDYSIGTIYDINTPFPPNTTTAFDINDYAEIFGIPQPNLLLDSDFKFWSEGLIINPTTYKYVSGGFACERNLGIAGTTISRQAGFDGARYSVRVQRDAGDTAINEVRLGQVLGVEDVISYGGKNVTLSFSVKKGLDYSALNNQLVSKIITSTITDEEGGNLIDFSLGSVTDSKTHVLIDNEFRFRHTLELPNGCRQIKVLLEFAPLGTALVNDYIDVTNIKLENSELATPYVSDSYAGAIDKLDEHYLTTYENGVSAGTITLVGIHSLRVPAHQSLNNFPFENLAYNFPRIPTAIMYSPNSNLPGKVERVPNAGASSTINAAFINVASRSASPALNTPVNLDDDDILQYHYVIDARL